MGIKETQALGGELKFDDTEADKMTAQLQRDPFGRNAAQSDQLNVHFKGFNYAKDTEQAGIFGITTAYVGPNTPTEGDDDGLWNKGMTTYGKAGQFTRLPDEQSTVLKQMAGFVKNGDATVATEWTNPAMKNDFTSGGGTRSQLARGMYKFEDGWSVPENGYNVGNPYDFNTAIDASVPDDEDEGDGDTGTESSTEKTETKASRGNQRGGGYGSGGRAG